MDSFEMSVEDEKCQQEDTIVFSSKIKHGGGSRRRGSLVSRRCDSEFMKKAYGGYFNVFVSTFGNGEQLDLFQVVVFELCK
ncbi:hypothetical protein Bca52824_033846 [Brassica carinata]|uniref:Uncharacterized protein n=1 Tax=Brassica carinata TaxID=52824 RepID=A0A8X7SER0_BRACI|nr:hypothetical protein Bca52824_033846 [Brassica carinata]